jgi:hypothetical protein
MRRASAVAAADQRAERYSEEERSKRSAMAALASRLALAAPKAPLLFEFRRHSPKLVRTIPLPARAAMRRCPGRAFKPMGRRGGRGWGRRAGVIEQQGGLVQEEFKDFPASIAESHADQIPPVAESSRKR